MDDGPPFSRSSLPPDPNLVWDGQITLETGRLEKQPGLGTIGDCRVSKSQQPISTWLSGGCTSGGDGGRRYGYCLAAVNYHHILVNPVAGAWGDLSKVFMYGLVFLEPAQLKFVM